MSQELSTVSTSSIEDFVHQMSAMRGEKTGSGSPKIVRLDGNTGQYVVKGWNQETKKSEDTPFSTPFNGTVILYRYFVQWKFGTTQKDIKLMSREFASFDHKIELLKIDYGTNKTEVVDTWQDYKAFKEAKKRLDPDTGKESYPFDFWCSLYVYIHETNEIIRYKFKGDTRSQWFDYQKAYKGQLGAIDLVQVVSSFGTEKEDMPASASQKEAKFYYRGTFDSVRLNTTEEMQKIMTGTAFLAKWMQGFEKAEETEPVQEASSTTTVESIDLSSIPF